jgi:beta-mannosidase
LFSIPHDLRRRYAPTRSCIVAAIGAQRAVWFDAPDKQIQYPPLNLSADIVRNGDTHHVTLRANRFVRDLCFAVDRLHPAAEISEQLFTLFAGEMVAFEIVAPRDIKPEELLAWPIMNCVNQFSKKISNEPRE